MASLNVIGGEIRSQPLNENFQNINTELTAHEAATTNVHGIADTSLLSRLPLGTLGYAQVTADQTGITTEVDLTGLSVTVNVADGRRIKISTQLYPYSTVDNDTVLAAIKEGTTTLCSTEYPKLSNANAATLSFSIVITPTAGTHTYKITGQRSAGTGSITFLAATVRPAFILVEDIGAV